MTNLASDLESDLGLSPAGRALDRCTPEGNDSVHCRGLVFPELDIKFPAEWRTALHRMPHDFDGEASGLECAHDTIDESSEELIIGPSKKPRLAVPSPGFERVSLVGVRSVHAERVVDDPRFHGVCADDCRPHRAYYYPRHARLTSRLGITSPRSYYISDPSETHAFLTVTRNGPPCAPSFRMSWVSAARLSKIAAPACWRPTPTHPSVSSALFKAWKKMPVQLGTFRSRSSLPSSSGRSTPFRGDQIFLSGFWRTASYSPGWIAVSP